MNQWDVVLVELPRPAGSAGHEQFGLRPAIVVQNELRGRRLSTVVVIPLTSNTNALHAPGAFLENPSPTNGLAVPSVVLVHQIRAIDRRRVKRVLGTIAPPAIEQLRDGLRLMFGLE